VDLAEQVLVAVEEAAVDAGAAVIVCHHQQRAPHTRRYAAYQMK
jgi:hypothetical protein